MRHLLLAVLVLAVACTAFGVGENPRVGAYISFDQTGAGGLIHEYQATPYVPFRAYVCFSQVDGGITAVSFALTDVMAELPGAFVYVVFVNLLPDGVGACHTGITLTSPECMAGQLVVVGYLELLPAVVSYDYCIELLDHPDYPRRVVDCQDPGQVNYYQIFSHGAINGAYCPADYEDRVYVVCEPQEPPNPTHPPTYWYRARADYGAYPQVFRVQVFDPNPEDYSNWVSPYSGPDQWAHSLEYDGENTWAVWSGSIPLMGSEVMFGFDNQNPPVWGDWQLGSYSSEDFSDYSDGYGYRVHVPVASTPVEDVSWTTIKALFR